MNLQDPLKDKEGHGSPLSEEEIARARLKIGLRHAWRSFLTFFRELINIQDGTDIPGTIAGIKKDSAFKGIQIWILIFSIFIASIGLNVNATAVIIGAMLISPLMGPILGIGMGVGINDFPTLMMSLRSFVNMTLVGVATSFFYFLITPLKPPVEELPELFSRTHPTLLDAGIAIFGGLAGIVAGSRHEKNNVIPGVAIATALMPPLCTAGYGLATAQWHFFLGAFYLYILNSVFICLSTVVVIRYLRFPFQQYVDKLQEKRIRRMIIAFTLIILVPSAWLFWGVVQEFRWKRMAESFYADNIVLLKNAKKELVYTDSTKIIEIYPFGERINPETEAQLRENLKKNGPEDTRLKIVQYNDKSGELSARIRQLEDKTREGFFADIYKENQQAMANKDARIALLENKLLKTRSDSLPVSGLAQEIQVQYPGIDAVSAGALTNGSTHDTVTVIILKWRRHDIRIQKEAQEKLDKWLPIRLKCDSVLLINLDI